MAINEKYSFKDFTNQDFLDVDPSEFSGTEIVGSCFWQSKGKRKIFPEGILGATFTRCNMDNVDLSHITCALVDTVNRQLDLCQKTKEYFIWDESKKKHTSLKPWRFTDLGITAEYSATGPADEVPLGQLWELDYKSKKA